MAAPGYPTPSYAATPTQKPQSQGVPSYAAITSSSQFHPMLVKQPLAAGPPQPQQQPPRTMNAPSGFGQQGVPMGGPSVPPIPPNSLTNMQGAASRLKKPTTMEEECHSFAEYLNSIPQLRNDPSLTGYMLINPNDESLYRACAESVLLRLVTCSRIRNSLVFS